VASLRDGQNSTPGSPGGVTSCLRDHPYTPWVQPAVSLAFVMSVRSKSRKLDAVGGSFTEEKRDASLGVKPQDSSLQSLVLLKEDFF
jgi:hypothetical protein